MNRQGRNSRQHQQQFQQGTPPLHRPPLLSLPQQQWPDITGPRFQPQAHYMRGALLQTPYPTQQMPYLTQQTPYLTQQTPYLTQQTPYPTPQTPYLTQSTPYPTQRTPQQTPYPTQQVLYSQVVVPRATLQKIPLGHQVHQPPLPRPQPQVVHLPPTMGHWSPQPHAPPQVPLHLPHQSFGQAPGYPQQQALLHAGQFADFRVAQQVVQPPPGHHFMPEAHHSQHALEVQRPPMRGADWYGASEEDFAERVKYPLQLNDIQVDLNVQTYKKKFNYLICWEEKSNIEILGKKCDRKCDLTLFQSGAPPQWIRSRYEYKVPMRYGFLENVNADQIAYATQASEALFIVSQDGSIQLRMEILKENYRHSDEKLFVAFREDQSVLLSHIITLEVPQGETIIHGLLVEFEVKHDYFNSLVKAVNSMHQGIIRRLLPTTEDFFEPIPVPEFDLKFLLSNVPFEIKIDGESQFNALRTIVSCNRSSPPLIVNGSFGTGKTRLLAVATHCLLDNGIRFTIPTRILVCAHHFHSVDHFIEKYFGKMFSERRDKIDLFRLISDSYHVRGSQYSHLYITAKGMQEYISSHDLSKNLLIVTEFLTAHPLLKMKIFEVGFFTHILIDEGSQIVEPQAIAALSLAGPNTKIVIVGDACQVGPSLSVLGEEARENGLKCSLQERLQNLYQELGGLALKHMCSLSTNYRCHESVIEIPNALFYEGKIKSSALNAPPHHLAKFPLVFVCSSLTDDVNRDLEAKLLMDSMEHYVIKNWPEEWGMRNWSNVCLTTATQTQLVITRTLSRQKYHDLSHLINILTAYRIQGTEFQAVFLSTTEPVDKAGNTTNPTKSPCDPYVFNTVLTRSKSLVVAVGSPVALLRIEDHMVKKYGKKAQCWSSYMKLCVEKGTFTIPSEIESDEKRRKEFKLALLSELSSRAVLDTNGEVSTRLADITKFSSADTLGAYGNQFVAGQVSNAATSRASLFSARQSQPAASIPPLTNGHSPLLQHQPSVTETRDVRSISVSIPPPMNNTTAPLQHQSCAPDPRSESASFSPSKKVSSVVPMNQAAAASPWMKASPAIGSSSTISALPQETASMGYRKIPWEPNQNLPLIRTPPITPPAVPAEIPFESRNQPGNLKPSAIVNHSVNQTGNFKPLISPTVNQPGNFKPTISPTVNQPGSFKPMINLIGNQLKPTISSSPVSQPGNFKPTITSPPSPSVNPPPVEADSVYRRHIEPSKRRSPGDSPRKPIKLATDVIQYQVAGESLPQPTTTHPYRVSSRAAPRHIPSDRETLLKEELTVDNYKEKLILLLDMEEQEHRIQLTKRCNKIYEVEIFGKRFIPRNLSYEDERRYIRYGYITSNDGDTLAYAKQASESSLIDLGDERIVQARHVQGKLPDDVYCNAIVIAFDQEQCQKLDSANKRGIFKAEVKFEFQEFYFKMQRTAIERISDEIVLKLNPSKEVFSSYRQSEFIPVSKPPYKSIELDEHAQMSALYLILKSSPELPVLITGSFGTGKTRLLARAAFEILKKRNSRVLICAHHQSSVDTFVNYFDTMKKIRKKNIWAVNMIRVIPNDASTRYGNYEKSKYRLTASDLENCQLVLTTFSTASSLITKVSQRSEGFFTDVLIDEGAQVREPEMVAALMLAGTKTRVVIAGDHYQVGPNTLVLGKKARAGGLGVSPLERLHDLYDKKKNLLSDSCSITLLTNYRCHCSILMLPSSLYYQSTLMCVAENITHPLAPFPLTFVCSDTQRDFSDGTSGVNEREADVLFQEVEKYFKKWPIEWSRREKKICIMTPSPNQLGLLRKKVKYLNIDEEIQCEVLPAYNIQGTEFEAIFVSTSEHTNDRCEPLNATKSTCDRYVFNTILTRSRSLVVVVGNPFLLLRMEESMIKEHNDSYKTWKPYIKQCLECNSFSYSEKSDMDKITPQLYECVYSDSDATSSSDNCFSPDRDSILENYQKVFESIRGCKIVKLILSSDKDARLSWHAEEKNHRHQKHVEEKISYSEKYRCKLNFLTYRTVEAIPVSDTSKKTVEIQGKRNLRYAFDGDIVEVGVFDDCPPDKQYGRVIKVERRGSSLKYICQVADYSPIVFFPIDKKNPKLINLPTLSRVILRKKRKEEIDQKSDLEYNDVFVFDPNSYERDADGVQLPRVVQVIPHAVAKKMLFLVSFVAWKKGYSNPLGIVVGACSLGHTLLKAELLLKMAHSVTFNSYSGDDFTDPQDLAEDAVVDTGLPTYGRAFTIDPNDAQNLDDALSIISQGTDNRGNKVYQVGVHIVNTAKHIVVGSDEDVIAKKRGISVYGGNKGGKMMHMLGNSDTRRALSLFPAKLRDVISITCDVTLRDHNNMDISTTYIHQAQIRSAFKLSYEHAQDLLRGRIPLQHAPMVASFDSDPHNPSLCESLRLLYDIAMVIRQRRLMSNSAFAYDIDDSNEVKNWQAHLLVEEFMIWANNEVAKKVHSDFPNGAILCKQEPPNQERLDKITENHIHTLPGSLQLSRYLRETGYDNIENDADIKLPYSILNRAMLEDDQISLAHLLSSERLYPQLAVVASKFPSIFKRSEYCCTEEGEFDPSAYSHYSLCLDKYTHFTSPIKRYVDIVVQRILLQQSDLSHEELEELCVVFNNSKKKASSYEKAIRRVRLACRLLSNSEVCIAYVCSQDHNSVRLAFPDPDLEYKDLSSSTKALEISRCFPHAKDSEVYTWKLRVTSLSQNYATKLLQQPNYRVSRHNIAATVDSEVDVLKAFSSSDATKLNTERFLAIPLKLYVEIAPNDWQAIQEFIKEPDSQNLFSRVQKVLKSLPSRPTLTPKNINASKATFLFLDCDIKLSLKESDPVKLWLSWSTRDPIISSAIQLLEVSPLLRICVQHNTHPADCFSDPDLQEASLEQYHSIEHYADLWKKVLLAEAAVKSVHECQPIVIRDVELKWPELKTPDGCIEVEYYIPTGCIEMVLPPDFVENCSEFFKIHIGDLICARYGCDQKDDRVRAIYHFVVYDVQEPKRGNMQDGNKQQETVILLEAVGKVNCQVSSKIKAKLKSKDEQYLCEIQIVPMTISYRKVFKGLLDLVKQKGSNLSRNVAVCTSNIKSRNKYPECTEAIHDIQQEELAVSISKWKSDSKLSITLNKRQKKSMKKALHKEFQLIQGPPGTGKSVTGAHIAYVMAKLNKFLNTSDSHKCVLYCGPSNKSVDVVFEKFVELLAAKPDLEVKILRIYSSAVERKDFPGPKHQTQQALPDNACPEWARPYSLHHLIRQAENREEEFVALAEFEQKLEDMAKNNQIASGKLCNQYRRVLNAAEEKFLTRKKYDIIFCTCNEASGGRMKRHWKRLTPRQCIIDECGMAYEPETIVPLSLCEHAVLIGDHMQLQPVIEYQPAKDHGLTTSLFERYATYYNDRIYPLTKQYRMHEAICTFPSMEFYNNSLKTADSVKKRVDNKDLEGFWPKGNECPIMFVDVVGEEGQDIGSSKREAKVGVDSKYNGKEAKLVIEIAKTLHHSHKIPLEEIAVLTPYSAQKNKILKMVKDLHESSLCDLKVASITESQGDEYGYVILSTVRSQPLEEIRHRHYIQPDRSWMTENLGFITDRHQINVGITRSKYGLIITGNKTLLEYDSTWKRLLQHYTEKECVEQDLRFLPP